MKPKYNFLKNAFYAIEGLKDILKNETSFKIELIIIIFLWIGLFFTPIQFTYKFILSISLFLPLFSEIINSAIERVVDLVTLEFHPMAKRAKDIGSSIVFLSITITLIIWAGVWYMALNG